MGQVVAVDALRAADGADIRADIRADIGVPPRRERAVMLDL